MNTTQNWELWAISILMRSRSQIFVDLTKVCVLSQRSSYLSELCYRRSMEVISIIRNCRMCIRTWQTLVTTPGLKPRLFMENLCMVLGCRRKLWTRITLQQRSISLRRIMLLCKVPQLNLLYNRNLPRCASITYQDFRFYLLWHCADILELFNRSLQLRAVVCLRTPTMTFVSRRLVL